MNTFQSKADAATNWVHLLSAKIHRENGRGGKVSKSGRFKGAFRSSL